MKNRLDKELVIKKFAPSRTKAQELIKENLVICNGKIVNKANFLVSEDCKIEIKSNNKLKYVSRGGLKLEKALEEFKISLEGLKIMDIGSSTGGFSDCALKHGAKCITAVDVGTNLLHSSLKNNKNIKLLEQTNFKNLDKKYFNDIDFFVCDVSFISLKQIIYKIYSVHVPLEGIFLIKPQFECGKDIARKYKGIILNKEVHINIINNLFEYFNSLKFYVKNLSISPIRGGDGNIEYLVYLSNKTNKNNNINVKQIVIDAFKK